MARPGPVPARRSSLVARGAGTRVAGWRSDAVVVRLTRKLHDLVTAAGRRSADTAVAIGQHLARIRDRLAHGEWRQWIEDSASFGRSTAAKYIDLAAWAVREPAEFARLRHLGPGKHYVLAAVPPPRLRAIRTGKLVAIPGTERKKTIEHMTTLELASVVGDLARLEAPVVAIKKVVQTVRFKVAALGAATDVMLARAREDDASGPKVGGKPLEQPPRRRRPRDCGSRRRGRAAGGALGDPREPRGGVPGVIAVRVRGLGDRPGFRSRVAAVFR